MNPDDTAELTVIEKKSDWRLWVVVPALSLFIGWLAAETRFGQALAAFGVVVLVDLLWVGWRTRGSKAVLHVPAIGRVGVPSGLGVLIEDPHKVTWLNSPTGVTVRPVIPIALGKFAQADAAYEGTNRNSITEQALIAPSRRGRTGFWSVDCVDCGLLGIVYRRRKFILAGRPFSVGPNRVASTAWQPIELSQSPDRLEGINMRVAAGQPVLRQWQPGDKTSAIDWRRTERLDHLVVGVGEAQRPRVAVLACLGMDANDIVAVEGAAAQWATVAEKWMAKADVLLVWNEQGQTHVRELESVADIDLALAGAEVGPLDSAVLTQAGVPLPGSPLPRATHGVGNL